MKTSHPLLRKTLLFVVGLFLILPVTAYYIVTIHNAETGETFTIILNGPPGQTGTIVLNSVTFSQNGILQIITPTPASGTTPFPVQFQALTTGNTNVFFSGFYKGNQVFGSTSVNVQPPVLTSGQNPFFAFGGDPVNTRNGEYLAIEAVDLNLRGPMPLMFVRYAATGLKTDGLAQGNLGDNRLHNFASRMINVSATQKKVVLQNGRVLTFEKTGTKWVLKKPLDVPFMLVESGTDFVLGDPHTQQMWTYNNQQQLVKIEDGRGNTHTLTYVGGLLDQVTDGLGRSLSFDYDSGNIISVTDHTNRSVLFAYTGSVLSSATDPMGHVTTYAYDGSLMTSFTRPENNTPFTQVFTDGKVTQQTERGTDISTLAYDTPAARMTTFTGPTGETLIDEYAASGQLIKHTDEAGSAINISKDATGRRTGAVDRAGDVTAITYHAGSGRPATIVNAEGKTTTMTYKSRTLSNGLTFYDLTKITLPDGSSRSFAYDTKGSITQITDEAAKTRKFTRNAHGQILTSTNPLGGVTTFDYNNTTGNLVSSKDPDFPTTGQTSYAYDSLNRLITITHPGGSQTGIAYNANDRITSITDELNHVYSYDYDDNSRLIGVTDPNNKTTVFAYDALDRVTSVTDRLNAMSSMIYNSRRLPASSTDANNKTTTYDYDARQRLTGTVDPGGKTWTLDYDNEGLLSSHTTPIEQPNKIKRNRLGQPIEINNPLGHTLLLQRDAMQRITKLFDGLGRQRALAYDKRGLLISATEQGTGSAKYDRDSMGSLAKVTDPNGGTWSFAYTKAGRLSLFTDPLAKKTTYTYDSRGRPLTIAYPDGTGLTFSYDNASNLIGRVYTDPAATNLVFDYDDLNRLTSANNVEFGYDDEGRITNTKHQGVDFSAAYDPGGRLTGVGYHGGAFSVTYGYDDRNRVISVSDSVTNNVVLNFAYDDAGRLTGLARPGTEITHTYTYDGAGRLTRIQTTGNAVQLLDLQYTLNAADEVTTVDYGGSVGAQAVPSIVPAVQNLKFDKASQILLTGYTYDARGRLTAAPTGHTYVWDGRSLLSSADGVLLTYDGLGQIMQRTTGPTLTTFYHNYALGLAPIVETIEMTPGAFRRYYVYMPGGRLLYSVDQNNVYSFYHFDRLGSTLALTDGAGIVTDVYAYTSYGDRQHVTGTSAQPFTFIGALGVRAEGGLYQMGARYYDPVTARFLSRDPIWPAVGRPKRANPYTYVDDNPMQFVDPSGQEGEGSNEPAGTGFGSNPFFNYNSSPLRGPGSRIAVNPANPDELVIQPVRKEHRVFNWTTIFDEVQDFENNVGGFSAPPAQGLICKPEGEGSTPTADFLATSPGTPIFHFNPSAPATFPNSWQNCNSCHVDRWGDYGAIGFFGSGPRESLVNFLNSIDSSPTSGGPGPPLPLPQFGAAQSGFSVLGGLPPVTGPAPQPPPAPDPPPTPSNPPRKTHGIPDNPWVKVGTAADADENHVHATGVFNR